jgi:hypothetical protein
VGSDHQNLINYSDAIICILQNFFGQSAKVDKDLEI